MRSSSFSTARRAYRGPVAGRKATKAGRDTKVSQERKVLVRKAPKAQPEHRVLRELKEQQEHKAHRVIKDQQELKD